jgi:tetratricopeptide (TPR) repeat protein
LAQSAKLGLATVLEAQGNMEAAKTQYLQIINSGQSSYVANAAKMGLARGLQLGGQNKEARQLYEEVIALGQNSPWFMQAYLQYIVLTRDMPPEKPEESSAQAPIPPTKTILQMPSLTTTH